MFCYAGLPLRDIGYLQPVGSQRYLHDLRCRSFQIEADKHSRKRHSLISSLQLPGDVSDRMVRSSSVFKTLLGNSSQCIMCYTIQ